jgi:beta-mannosidase
VSVVVADLGGDAWELTDLTVAAGSDSRHRTPAVVPGSVHLDLLASGEIPDPFHRENEVELAWIGDHDWSYARRFDVADELWGRGHHLLRFHGLDTLAEVTLNGRRILVADNMHRRWDVDVTGLLRREGNELDVRFGSANSAIRLRQAERRLPGWYTVMSIEGTGWLRKQLSNFGWDWGPSLVTAGVWRPVELIGYDDLLVTHVAIDQEHAGGAVALEVRVEMSSPLPPTHVVTVELRDPDGILVDSATGIGGGVRVQVPSPRLWWPNGLGEQPLYQVGVTVARVDGAVVAGSSRRIGLRTLRLVREPDADGETFGFECNGVPFFAKGANWIPADAVVGRPGASAGPRGVMDAAPPHKNNLRGWGGGGVYEDDAFYDACDEAGICVWQDAAFACVTFPGTDREYVASVRAEVEDNVRRLRHHPSLALWCGNNELEMGLVGDEWNDWQMPWSDYTPMMDEVIPEVVRRLDRQRDYWPASPHTPGELRTESNSPAAGDAHLWKVWHGGERGGWYRTSTHRFVSEFGFQSYPHPSTMAAVTDPGDRDLASPVVDAHQKATAAGASGNAELARQLVQSFRSPATWDDLIWQTQLLQALTVTTGIEHWRRSMARTRGVLYWQLNDCWPGPSWSSIDYRGHWKALHHAARRAFAPVMLSLVEDVVASRAEVHVSNDGRESVTLPVDWTVLHTDGRVLGSGAHKATVEAQASLHVLTVDATSYVAEHGARNVVVYVTIPDHPAQRSMTAFVPMKHLSLQDPVLSVTRAGREVTITADRPAPWVWLDAGDMPLRLSDNFFAMAPGSYAVTLESSPAGEVAARSLVDTIGVGR